jgi:hypothetical protein
MGAEIVWAGGNLAEANTISFQERPYESHPKYKSHLLSRWCIISSSAYLLQTGRLLRLPMNLGLELGSQCFLAYTHRILPVLALKYCGRRLAHSTDSMFGQSS